MLAELILNLIVEDVRHAPFYADAPAGDVHPAILIPADPRFGLTDVPLKAGSEVDAQPVAHLQGRLLCCSWRRSGNDEQKRSDGTHMRVNDGGARCERVFKKRGAALTGAWTTQNTPHRPWRARTRRRNGTRSVGMDLVRGANRGANRRRHCDRRARRDGASQIYVRRRTAAGAGAQARNLCSAGGLRLHTRAGSRPRDRPHPGDARLARCRRASLDHRSPVHSRTRCPGLLSRAPR